MEKGGEGEGTRALKLVGNLSRQEGGLLVSQLALSRHFFSLYRIWIVYVAGAIHGYHCDRGRLGVGVGGGSTGDLKLTLLSTADVKALADAAIRCSFGTD